MSSAPLAASAMFLVLALAAVAPATVAADSCGLLSAGGSGSGGGALKGTYVFDGCTVTSPGNTVEFVLDSSGPVSLFFHDVRFTGGGLRLTSLGGGAVSHVHIELRNSQFVDMRSDAVVVVGSDTIENVTIRAESSRVETSGGSALSVVGFFSSASDVVLEAINSFVSAGHAASSNDAGVCSLVIISQSDGFVSIERLRILVDQESGLSVSASSGAVVAGVMSRASGTFDIQLTHSSITVNRSVVSADGGEHLMSVGVSLVGRDVGMTASGLQWHIEASRIVSSGQMHVGALSISAVGVFTAAISLVKVQIFVASKVVVEAIATIRGVSSSGVVVSADNIAHASFVDSSLSIERSADVTARGNGFGCSAGWIASHSSSSRLVVTRSNITILSSKVKAIVTGMAAVVGLASDAVSPRIEVTDAALVVANTSVSGTFIAGTCVGVVAASVMGSPVVQVTGTRIELANADVDSHGSSAAATMSVLGIGSSPSVVITRFILSARASTVTARGHASPILAASLGSYSEYHFTAPVIRVTSVTFMFCHTIVSSHEAALDIRIGRNLQNGVHALSDASQISDWAVTLLHSELRTTFAAPQGNCMRALPRATHNSSSRVSVIFNSTLDCSGVSDEVVATHALIIAESRGRDTDEAAAMVNGVTAGFITHHRNRCDDVSYRFTTPSETATLSRPSTPSISRSKTESQTPSMMASRSLTNSPSATSSPSRTPSRSSLPTPSHTRSQSMTKASTRSATRTTTLTLPKPKQLPPAQRPVLSFLPDGASQPVEISAVAATAAVSSQSPSVGLSMTRMNAAAMISGCAFSHISSLPRTFNPTGMEFGAAHGAAYRGAIVGNLALFAVICGLFTLVLLALTAIRFCISGRFRTLRNALSRTVADMHVPSVIFVPAAPCYQATVGVSVSALIHAHDRWDYLYGASGLAVCLAFPLFTLWVTSLRGSFPCVLQPRDASHMPRSTTLYDRAHRFMFWTPQRWANHNVADPLWKQRYYFFFGDFRVKSYVAFEFLAAFFVGIAEGIRISERRVCIVMSTVPLLASLFLLYLLLWWDAAMVRNTKMFLVSLNALVVGLCGLILAEIGMQRSTHTVHILSDVAFLVSMAKTIVDAMLVLWWAFHHRSEIQAYVVSGERIKRYSSSALDAPLQVQFLHSSAEVPSARLCEVLECAEGAGDAELDRLEERDCDGARDPRQDLALEPSPAGSSSSSDCLKSISTLSSFGPPVPPPAPSRGSIVDLVVDSFHNAPPPGVNPMLCLSAVDSLDLIMGQSCTSARCRTGNPLVAVGSSTGIGLCDRPPVAGGNNDTLIELIYSSECTANDSPSSSGPSASEQKSCNNPLNAVLHSRKPQYDTTTTPPETLSF